VNGLEIKQRGRINREVLHPVTVIVVGLNVQEVHIGVCFRDLREHDISSATSSRMTLTKRHFYYETFILGARQHVKLSQADEEKQTCRRLTLMQS
jgi:hypothetical protein